jgi:DNA (cytosine-5)-methyltransferase 1
MKSVELFSGAGGLAIGVSKAGFCHKAVIERDKNACFDNSQKSVSGCKSDRQLICF